MATESEVQTKDALLTRLDGQFNEDRLFKDLSGIQIGRLKTLDEIAQDTISEKRIDEVRPPLRENLSELPGSLTSRYLLGILGFADDSEEDQGLLIEVMGEFSRAAKWAIVDHVADRILDNDENHRAALRAKVEATERLKGKKELGPYLERLASIDRKNPDIVKKFGLSILEEDKPRALKQLKLAAETYARLKDYRGLEEIWNLMVEKDHEDLAFFERIERILSGNREKTRLAAYLVALVEPFRIAEDWDNVITLLKKILEYEPNSSRSRSDLVRAYRARYEDHSLLNEFLKMSDLTNHKKPVGNAISSFERNIVFDKDNYVNHRTRGVGKIQEIGDEHMIVDFHDNPGQRMSIQMAISSLQPLSGDHIWVQLYENEADVRAIFESDLLAFFEMLLSSFGNSMVLADIKAEIVPRFLELPEWSKWWSRARAQLKKAPKFGFNPRKKDELLLREAPMSLSEELSVKFQSLMDWNKKLDLALETLKDSETEGAAELCIQFYRENEEHKDILKRIHSFLFLEHASNALGDEIPDRKIKKGTVKEIIREQTPETLVGWCAETPQVEFKRDFVNLYAQTRDDYPEILSTILLEVPIKINKHAFNELKKQKQTETLSAWLRRVFTRYREHPEVFLWAAKQILSEQWTFDWIEYDREDVLLLVFRLLKPLAKIEKKGTRLKNSAVDAIFGTTTITVDAIKQNDLVVSIVKDADLSTLRRMYALFRDVPYVADAHKENFLQFLQESRSDFSMDIEIEEEEEQESEDNLFPDEGVILASEPALQKRREYLDRLINVDMPANSRDIGEAQEKGDLRENAEYKAALEKQSQLQAEIKTLSEEVKRARSIQRGDIRTDLVSIGTRVEVQRSDGDREVYTILGPWDADTENNIISYESPLARALIGKNVGETAQLDADKTFQIEAIESAL